MSLETNASPNQEPNQEPNDTKKKYRHSGHLGYELPVHEDGKTLEEAIDAKDISTSGPESTEDLPAHLQVGVEAPTTPDTNDTDREEAAPSVKNTKRSPLVNYGAPLALLAAGVGIGTAISRGSQTPKPATSVSVPVAPVQPAPSASGTTIPQPTPEASPRTALTPEDVKLKAESLSIPVALYDPSYLKNFVVPFELDNKLRVQYPNYSAVFGRQANIFNGLTAERLLELREEYTALLQRKTYDTQSLRDGTPREISFAELVTAPSQGGGVFPDGWTKTDELKTYGESVKGVAGLEQIEQRIPLDAVRNTFMEPQTTWVAENENAINTYNAQHPTKDGTPALKPEPITRAFIAAQFAPDSDNIGPRAKAFMEQPGMLTPLDTEDAHLVNVMTSPSELGPNPVSIEGITVMYGRADTKEKYLASFVLVPLDRYAKDGKIVEGTYLQPVLLDQTPLKAL